MTNKRKVPNKKELVEKSFPLFPPPPPIPPSSPPPSAKKWPRDV
jgi:hypothetical protein